MFFFETIHIEEGMRLPPSLIHFQICQIRNTRKILTNCFIISVPREDFFSDAKEKNLVPRVQCNFKAVNTTNTQLPFYGAWIPSASVFLSLSFSFPFSLFWIICVCVNPTGFHHVCASSRQKEHNKASQL